MIKVIIVEDEENIRKSVEYSVNWDECGCVVAGTAWNGNEGLALIENIKPDIVISDVSMPFKNGLEMIEEARNTDHRFEAIIISGYSDFEYAKSAIHLGVSDYILKPIDYKEVEESLIKLKNKIYSRRDNVSENELVFYSQRMKDILDYIDQNIESKLSLNVLTDEFGVSTTSLNKLFKKEINTTVNDYINKAKINKSIELLKSEKYLIYEVAEMLGFSDYKYFSHVFKKYTNRTPTEFLKQNNLL